MIRAVDHAGLSPWHVALAELAALSGDYATLRIATPAGAIPAGAVVLRAVTS